ncbi:Cullin repeat-like-containing domain containing protein [Trema orientale]|uniref:Cullin repeat-like-containing domain containing protein n=1 Tax=Trema orientale TaxID=63057 RepID=A0A2P5AMR6_TREOI|nr:Cullin repeat-like-containing domain containing protein [Trema orientale]
MRTAHVVEIDGELRRLLDDAMEAIDASANKINMLLDNGVPWTTEDKMSTYTKVYKTFAGRQPLIRNYMLKFLYDKYESLLEQRIFEKVIPSLENKKGKLLLKEVVDQYWSEQQHYTRNLLKIFHCVEYSGAAVRIDAPSSLIGTSKTCFCYQVWRKFHSEIDKALMDLKEENLAIDVDENDLNILKCKVTEFFYVTAHISDERLKISFDLWKRR